MYLGGALEGLTPQKKKRLLSDLDKQLDEAWQDMAHLPVLRHDPRVARR